MFIWFLHFKGVKDAIELENELNINFCSEHAMTDRLNKHPIIVTQSNNLNITMKQADLIH